MNIKRLKTLADYLDKLSKDAWDFHVFAKVDSDGNFLRGDALGHCTIIWPEFFKIENRRISVPGSTLTPVKFAMEFFDIDLDTYLKLFGVSHCMENFGTLDVTASMVSNGIKSLIVS